MCFPVRSVPKFNSYFCMADGTCQITPSTRKNCQFCRYHGCLRAGMKSSWVLSDKEKLERTAKKMENRARRMRAMQAKQEQQLLQERAQFGHLMGLKVKEEEVEHDRVQPSRAASTGSSSGLSTTSPAASPPLSSSSSSSSSSTMSAAAAAACAMLMLQQQGCNRRRMERVVTEQVNEQSGTE